MLLGNHDNKELLKMYENLGVKSDELLDIENFLAGNISKEEIKNKVTKIPLRYKYELDMWIRKLRKKIDGNNDELLKNIFVLYNLFDESSFFKVSSIEKILLEKDGDKVAEYCSMSYTSFVEEYISNICDSYGLREDVLERAFEAWSAKKKEFNLALKESKYIDTKAIIAAVKLKYEDNVDKEQMLEYTYRYIKTQINKMYEGNDEVKRLVNINLDNGTKLEYKKILSVKPKVILDKCLLGLVFENRYDKKCNAFVEFMLDVYETRTVGFILAYQSKYGLGHMSRTTVSSGITYLLSTSELRVKYFRFIAEATTSFSEELINSYHRKYPNEFMIALDKVTDSTKIVEISRCTSKKVIKNNIKHASKLLDINTLVSNNYLTDKQKKTVIDYVNGNSKLEKVPVASYIYSMAQFEYISLCIENEDVTDYNRRFFQACLRMSLDNSRAIKTIVKNILGLDTMIDKHDDRCKMFVDKLNSYGVEKEIQIAFLMSVVENKTKGIHESAARIVEDIIENDIERVYASLKIMTIAHKNMLMDHLVDVFKEIGADEKIKYKDIIVHLSNESAKGLVDNVIKVMQAYSNKSEFLLELVKSKKANTRAMAVLALDKYKEEKEVKEILKEIEQSDKSEKVKNNVRSILNIVTTEENDIQDVSFLVKCKKIRTASIKWILEDLPKLRYKESGEEVEQDVVNYLLYIYSKMTTITINPEGENLVKLINEEDISDLAYKIINKWLDINADTKKKWALVFAGTYGDSRVISLLKDQIVKWSGASRGTMATYAIKVLGLNGSDEALFYIDSVRNKFKYKQVKKAASEAIDIAAKELKISAEELSDRLIPTLGFNEDGEQIFDYGTRKFTVTLDENLQVIVTNESGKQLKNLPAVGKRDDEELAKKSKKAFSALKKQLKTVVNVQKDRLEYALSVNRMWTVEKWEKIFVGNHIMHKFAMGLIWGVYEENKLVETFRYMDDGTYNSYDEEELDIKEIINEKRYVGLVHPIELSKELLDAWNEQLEDYEINQPIDQLNRTIYIVNEEESKSLVIERFAGYVISGLSLVSKLQKIGWSIGSILDGGGYCDMYKEIGDVSVQVNLSPLYVGMTAYDAEDAMLFEYMFYKTKSVARGSYIYDDMTKERIINPKEVPPRIFSEIAHDFKVVTAKYSERDMNWKNNSEYYRPFK